MDHGTSAFDEAPVTSSSVLNDLLDKAEEMIRLEAQISDLEQLMKQLSGRNNELKTVIIPDKMAEIGITEFAVPSGQRIKVEDFVSGSLPKDPERRNSAIEALEEWGATGALKNEVVLSFEKSQHNEAMAIVDDLRQRGYQCEVTSGIHPQTYLALIRERLAAGETIDPERMGIFIGRKTKVIAPRAKK